MTYTDKEDVEGSSNSKTSINNTIHAFFYYNIYEFGGNLEGMLYEGTYQRNIQNMQNLGWKSQFFKSADSSMMVHGCGVS